MWKSLFIHLKRLSSQEWCFLNRLYGLFPSLDEIQDICNKFETIIIHFVAQALGYLTVNHLLHFSN